MEISLSNRTILRILSSITAFVLIIILAYTIRLELAVIGAAFFLAVATNPLVVRLQNWLPVRSRGVAVVVTVVMVLIALGLLAWLLIPPLIQQSHVLLRQLPNYESRLEQTNQPIARLIVGSSYWQQLRTNHNQVIEQAFFSRGTSVLHFVRTLFTSLFYSLMVITLTIFMLLEGPDWARRFWAVMPSRQRQHRQKLAEAMYLIINRYVTVNLGLAVLAGGLTTLLLLLIHVPYVVPLGFVFGVLGLVPLVGALIGGAIVVAVCLFSSLPAAIIMTLFFIVFQYIKDNVLLPMILAKTIALSPLAILIAIVIGAALGGLLGALVAVPLGGCLQVLVKDYLSSHSVTT